MRRYEYRIPKIIRFGDWIGSMPSNAKPCFGLCVMLLTWQVSIPVYIWYKLTKFYGGYIDGMY